MIFFLIIFNLYVIQLIRALTLLTNTHKGAIKQSASSPQKDVTGIRLQLPKDFYGLIRRYSHNVKYYIRLITRSCIVVITNTWANNKNRSRISFSSNIQFIYVFYECRNVDWRVLNSIPGGNRVVYYNKTWRECFYDNFLWHIKP